MSGLDLRAFAAEVAGADPVTCEGGRTQWSVGGGLAPGCRVVRAPAGIVAYEPAEMTVRVGAGTTVAELHDALARHGQRTALAGDPGATVGGVLAVGHDPVGVRRDGRVRDALLQARVALADGRVVTMGGPTVKNVSGYDLCRLLVGSLGTLGFVGEVILRTRPAPRAACWLAGGADPASVEAALYRPSAVLWDGTTTWVLLEGYPADVEAQQQALAALGLAPVAAGPALGPVRSSLPPAALAGLPARLGAGSFVAQWGVGVVHTAAPFAPAAAPSAAVAEIHRRLREAFDPSRRLNPGRDPFARTATVPAPVGGPA